MRIDWMGGDRHALAESIPPAYTEFLGEQLLAHMQHVANAGNGLPNSFPSTMRDCVDDDRFRR